MKKILNANQPAIIALFAYWIFVIALLMMGIKQTGNELVYPLDDAYIHMAIAKNFATHGVWGISSTAFSSSTTSPLWTFLLAIAYIVGGVHTWIPLLLNALSGSIFIVYLYKLLRAHAKPTGTVLYLLLIIAATPLPSITLLGMEHTLHIFLTLVFVIQAAKKIQHHNKEEKYPTGLLVLAAILPMARYEGVFAIVLVCLIFAWQRRFKLAFLLGLSSFLPLFFYGCISILHDWLPIPNSVILKGHPPSWESFRNILDALGLRAIKQLVYNSPLISVVLLTSLYFYRSQTEQIHHHRYPNLTPLYLCLLLMHLQFASTGWLYRYEAYLLTLGLVVAFPIMPWFIGQLAQPILTRRLASIIYFLPAICVVSIVMVPLANRARYANAETVQAMFERYLEHIQPARFVQKFYSESTVVINDIGAMSYFCSNRFLDMYGLGNMEPLWYRRDAGGYTKEDVLAWTRAENAEIAILQIQWSEVWPRIPDSWIQVSIWEIPHNIVFTDTKFGFFALTPQAAQTLSDNIEAFKPYLPNDVAVTMLGNRMLQNKMLRE